MRGISVVTLHGIRNEHFLKIMFINYDLYLITLICSSIVYFIIKSQVEIYLYFSMYFVVKWCECILLSVFCFDICQCNTDMKIEKIVQLNALSTDELLSNTRFKVLKML